MGSIFFNSFTFYNNTNKNLMGFSCLNLLNSFFGFLLVRDLAETENRSEIDWFIFIQLFYFGKSFILYYQQHKKQKQHRKSKEALKAK